MNSKFNDLVNSEGNVLIDFHAEWCVPCKVMAPILLELKKIKGDSLKIIKIDVDRNPEISEKLRISGVPTLIYYQKGELKWRRSGVVPINELKNLC